MQSFAFTVASGGMHSCLSMNRYFFMFDASETRISFSVKLTFHVCTLLSCHSRHLCLCLQLLRRRTKSHPMCADKAKHHVRFSCLEHKNNTNRCNAKRCTFKNKPEKALRPILILRNGTKQFLRNAANSNYYLNFVC